MDGFVHITKVEKTRHEEPVAVYNFHVKEWISFFVGRIKIYVHNSPGEHPEILKYKNGSNVRIPWSSKVVSDASDQLDNGAKSVSVNNRSQAEELFLGKYQGKGYTNVTGMDAMDAKNFLGGKGNTYHWDDTFGPDGYLTGHGAGNIDVLIPHIQIHPKKGNVIRIFFKNIGVINLKLDTRQINNLYTGVKLVTELRATNDNLRKFLTVQGYSYDVNGEIIEFNKILNKNILNDIYFELRCYEISVDYYINHWDVTEDNLINEIYQDDIKGIDALELQLKKYIEDFSVLKPEWYCDNLL